MNIFELLGQEEFLISMHQSTLVRVSFTRDATCIAQQTRSKSIGMPESSEVKSGSFLEVVFTNLSCFVKDNFTVYWAECQLPIRAGVLICNQ